STSSDCSGKDKDNWTVIPFPEQVTVLDCSGKVEENGQTTLFYDDSHEPPDPDEFENLNDYNQAFAQWQAKHPDIPTVFMSEFIEVDDGDFLEELPTKIEGWHFEEGQVYWHSKRQLKFKIIKLLKSVSKAQGYFEKEVTKEKINLCELLPLPEQTLPICETTTQQEPEPINSENCAIAPILPEQADDDVLEKPVINQWVEPYYVKRGEKKFWYFRYCYYQKRIKHIHIPGGCTTSQKAQEMKEKVENAIAQHKPPSEIEKLIKPA
ncbi:hypothetical protein A0J48_026395, partial [Sphaerospermopsis aphanizomenoides BCCUSP55]|nr:hypothetical protein [Sphaerospermopsis aphanizomenoides BCCUSP55]